MEERLGTAPTASMRVSIEVIVPYKGCLCAFYQTTLNKFYCCKNVRSGILMFRYYTT